MSKKTKKNRRISKKKTPKKKAGLRLTKRKIGQPRGVSKRAKVAKKAPDKKAGKAFSEAEILKLIEKGRHRGFITEAEILHTFPNVEKDI
jgi:hypothetical protein